MANPDGAVAIADAFVTIQDEITLKVTVASGGQRAVSSTRFKIEP
jgi:hypothetical protein